MMSELRAELAERVRRGAEELDRIDPDWRDKIDLEHFDMQYGFMINDGDCGCVLSQLNKDHSYFGMLRELGWTEYTARKLGFTINNIMYAYEAEYWDMLTELWMEVIKNGE